MKKQAMTDERKAEQRTRRAEAKRLREEEEGRAHERFLESVRDRRESLSSIVPAFRVHVDDIARRQRERESLLDHASGFYDEMEKLAKGRSLLGVTDLMVQRANEIIGDAKGLVIGDPYLDRVKEFVPAGDNPVYPDVVVQLRIVRGSLERFEAILDELEEDAAARMSEALTMVAALEAFGEDEEVPSFDRVKGIIEDEEDLVASWFHTDDAGYRLFDLGRLQDLNVEAYFDTSPRAND